jgi:predicted HTH domain antitoxin
LHESRAGCNVSRATDFLFLLGEGAIGWSGLRGSERYHEVGAFAMDSTILDLGEDISGFLATLGRLIDQTVREMIVFELYRRGLVSSGKAAELLGIPRLEFIQRASELGIPYFRFTEDEWRAEVAESKRD